MELAPAHVQWWVLGFGFCYQTVIRIDIRFVGAMLNEVWYQVSHNATSFAVRFMALWPAPV